MNYYLKNGQLYAFLGDAPSKEYKAISFEEAKSLASSVPVPKTKENITRTIQGLMRDLNELRKGMEWGAMATKDKEEVTAYYQSLSEGNLPKQMPNVLKKLGFCEDCYLG